ERRAGSLWPDDHLPPCPGLQRRRQPRHVMLEPAQIVRGVYDRAEPLHVAVEVAAHLFENAERHRWHPAREVALRPLRQRLMEVAYALLQRLRPFQFAILQQRELFGPVGAADGEVGTAHPE